jgi:hypothetical protein
MRSLKVILDISQEAIDLPSDFPTFFIWYTTK